MSDAIRKETAENIILLYQKTIDEGNFTDSAEFKAAEDELYNFYWCNPLFKSIRNQLETLISVEMAAAMQQYFTLGFLTAFKTLGIMDNNDIMEVLNNGCNKEN